MKKKPFITVETENLAVPEVHIDKEDVEEATDTRSLYQLHTEGQNQRL